MNFKKRGPKMDLKLWVATHVVLRSNYSIERSNGGGDYTGHTLYWNKLVSLGWVGGWVDQWSYQSLKSTSWWSYNYGCGWGPTSRLTVDCNLSSFVFSKGQLNQSQVHLCKGELINEKQWKKSMPSRLF